MHSQNQPYSEVGEDFYDHIIQNLEIKNFATEMIGTAIRDARQFRFPEIREDALRWINARDSNVCGYGWALANSGINPNLVRQVITAAEKRHQDKIARENRREAVLAIVEAE